MSPAAPAQRVFLATPTYDSLSPGYTYALFHSAEALREAGIAAELAVYAGDCHVDDARNRLVRDFLESECTDLVFLDADLRWEPKDLVALCRYDRDVVAASYPLKQSEERFPVQFIDGAQQAGSDGLLDVEAVPTGFLRIRRHVLERLASKAPKFRAKRDGDGRMPLALIFERCLSDGMRIGGDYTFCRKWRAIGGRVFVAPEMVIEHTGAQDWRGSLGSWLRRENGLSMIQGLGAIRRGEETAETLMEILTAWGNPAWSATPELLQCVISLAREAAGGVLECGSGITSLCMAAANPGLSVHALEHDPAWASHVRSESGKAGIGNLTVHCAPLKDGWYDPPADLPAEFGLVLVDGPPRRLSDRSAVLRSGVAAKVWVFDDAADQSVSDAVDALCAERGLSFHAAECERPFFIVYDAKSREAA